MIQLSFFEKLEQLFNIIKSSSLFTIIAVLMLILIISLFIDYKKTKSVNEVTFLVAFITLVAYIICNYYESLLSLGDNFFGELVKAIYFPNIAVYFMMLVSVNLVMIYTLFENKFYIHKMASIITSFIIDYLFLITLDVVVSEKIDVYEKLTVYSNKQLLSLIELTSIIFTVYVIFTMFVKLVNRTINSSVEVPDIIEQSVKEMPTYVEESPTYITSNDYVNEKIGSSLETTPYTTIKLTPEELYNKFKKGENLTREQYLEIKNYLLTK